MVLFLPNGNYIVLSIPVYKCGDKCVASNYRPISLLCNLSKVLEKLVYNEIIDAISNSLSPVQFGFFRHRSTLQQLLLFIYKTLVYLQDADCVDVIYLDIRKAFDSVPHDRLLSKLVNFNIGGVIWKWFRDYFTGRHQFVRVNKTCSCHLPSSQVSRRVVF